MFKKIKNLFKKAKETAKKIGKAILELVRGFFEDEVLTISDGVAGIVWGVVFGMFLVVPQALQYKHEAAVYRELFGNVNKLPVDDLAKMLSISRGQS